MINQLFSQLPLRRHKHNLWWFTHHTRFSGSGNTLLRYSHVWNPLHRKSVGGNPLHRKSAGGNPLLRRSAGGNPLLWRLLAGCERRRESENLQTAEVVQHQPETNKRKVQDAVYKSEYLNVYLRLLVHFKYFIISATMNFTPSDRQLPNIF